MSSSDLTKGKALRHALNEKSRNECEIYEDARRCQRQDMDREEDREVASEWWRLWHMEPKRTAGRPENKATELHTLQSNPFGCNFFIPTWNGTNGQRKTEIVFPEWLYFGVLRPK